MPAKDAAARFRFDGAYVRLQCRKKQRERGEVDVQKPVYEKARV